MGGRARRALHRCYDVTGREVIAWREYSGREYQGQTGFFSILIFKQVTRFPPQLHAHSLRYLVLPVPEPLANPQHKWVCSSSSAPLPVDTEGQSCCSASQSLLVHPCFIFQNVVAIPSLLLAPLYLWSSWLYIFCLFFYCHRNRVWGRNSNKCVLQPAVVNCKFAIGIMTLIL